MKTTKINKTLLFLIFFFFLGLLHSEEGTSTSNSGTIGIFNYTYSYNLYGLNKWYFKEELNHTTFSLAVFLGFVPGDVLNVEKNFYYTLECNDTNSISSFTYTGSGNIGESSYDPDSNTQFISLFVGNISYHDFCKVNLNLNVKSTNENEWKTLNLTFFISPSSYTTIIDKKPGEGWVISSIFSCGSMNNKSCNVVAPLKRSEGELFKLKDQLQLKLEVSPPNVEGVNINSNEGIIEVSENRVEYVDWNSLKISCNIKDYYNTMNFCPYNLSFIGSGLYSVNLGPCEPNWYITQASDDDYFNIQCNGSVDVVSVLGNGSKIRNTYYFSTSEIRINISGIDDADTLANLIRKNINDVTSTYSSIAVMLSTLGAYQQTAAMMLIAFGRLMETTIDCGKIDIKVNREGKIESSLKQILGLSKATWCSMLNGALAATRAILLHKMLSGLEEQYDRINISDDLKMTTKLEGAINTMLKIAIAKGGACTLGAVYYLYNHPEDITNEDSDSVMLSLFKAVCPDYYSKIKNLVEIKKKCKEGEVEEEWRKICISKLTNIQKQWRNLYNNNEEKAKDIANKLPESCSKLLNEKPDKLCTYIGDDINYCIDDLRDTGIFEIKETGALVEISPKKPPYYFLRKLYEERREALKNKVCEVIKNRGDSITNKLVISEKSKEKCSKNVKDLIIRREYITPDLDKEKVKVSLSLKGGFKINGKTCLDSTKIKKIACEAFLKSSRAIKGAFSHSFFIFKWNTLDNFKIVGKKCEGEYAKIILQPKKQQNQKRNTNQKNWSIVLDLTGSIKRGGSVKLYNNTGQIVGDVELEEIGAFKKYFLNGLEKGIESENSCNISYRQLRTFVNEIYTGILKDIDDLFKGKTLETEIQPSYRNLRVYVDYKLTLNGNKNNLRYFCCKVDGKELECGLTNENSNNQPCIELSEEDVRAYNATMDKNLTEKSYRIFSELSSLRELNYENYRELCEKSLAGDWLEQNMFLISSIFSLIMQDIGKRIELLGMAIKQATDCYLGNFMASMFFFYTDPTLARYTGFRCSFTPIATFNREVGKDASTIEKLAKMVGNILGPACALQNINSKCTAQTFSILTANNWKGFGFGIGGVWHGMTENPFKPLEDLFKGKKEKISASLFKPILSLKPEKPDIYYEGEIDKSLKIDNMNFLTVGLSNSVYGFVVKAITGTMIPCAYDMSQRLNEFTQLLQKNTQCLIAYIAPEYFTSMQASSLLGNIKEDFNQIKPYVEDLASNEEFQNKINNLNQDISELESSIKDLAMEDVGLYTVSLPDTNGNIDWNTVWKYYEIYKKLNIMKTRLDAMKTMIESRSNINEKLKNDVLNKIDNVKHSIDEAIDAIPPNLKQWFDKRQKAIETSQNNINLLELALNPDPLKGIPECLNFTRDIYCKQVARQAICYTSFLGLYIQKMLSQEASSTGTFIEDFARRLGGKQTIDTDKMVEQFKESIKQICGESVDSINTMYQNMKEMVETASTTMYDLQTKSCNGNDAKILDDVIKVLDCKDNGIIKVQETFGLTICGVKDPYGLKVTTREGLTLVDPNKVNIDEELKKVGKVVVQTGTSVGITPSQGFFLLGKNTEKTTSYQVVVKTTINCSNYLKNEGSNGVVNSKIKEAIKDCINNEYKLNVDWNLVIFNEEKINNKIEYTYKQDLGSYSSSLIPREINTNFPNQCSSTKSSNTQETQNYCKEHEEEIKKNLEKEGKRVMGVFDSINEALKKCDKPLAYNLNKGNGKIITCQICIG